MGVVMVKCPAMGLAFSTGIEADAARFRSTPVFFGRSHCPHCRIEHEWFASDAWVDEPAGEGADASTAIPPRSPV